MERYGNTEQLIQNANYRKHKAKLTQIRKHNTSLQFYNSGPNRPQDKKKIMLLKERRHEIELENKKLKDKIERLNRTGHSQQPTSRRKIISESMGRAGRKAGRYDGQQQEVIEMQSDYDGAAVKCIVPATYGSRRKNQYQSFFLHKNEYGNLMTNKDKLPQLKVQQREEPQQTQTPGPALNSEQNRLQEPMLADGRQKNGQTTSRNTFDPESMKKLKEIVRSQLPADGKDDFLYNQPQKQAHRVILFKKTKIPEPMVCYVIELSLIDSRILAVVTGMGLQTQDYRLLLNKKRSRQLMHWADGDYQKIWERVHVSASGIRITDETDGHENTRKDHHLEGASSEKQYNKIHVDKLKRLQITQDFLQRNYYLLKDTLKDASIDQKRQSASLHESKVKKQPIKPSVLRTKIQFNREANNNDHEDIDKTQQKKESVKKEKPKLALATQNKLQPRQSNMPKEGDALDNKKKEDVPQVNKEKKVVPPLAKQTSNLSDLIETPKDKHEIFPDLSGSLIKRDTTLVEKIREQNRKKREQGEQSSEEEVQSIDNDIIQQEKTQKADSLTQKKLPLPIKAKTNNSKLVEDQYNDQFAEEVVEDQEKGYEEDYDEDIEGGDDAEGGDDVEDIDDVDGREVDGEDVDGEDVDEYAEEDFEDNTEQKGSELLQNQSSVSARRPVLENKVSLDESVVLELQIESPTKNKRNTIKEQAFEESYLEQNFDE